MRLAAALAALALAASPSFAEAPLPGSSADRIAAVAAALAERIAAVPAAAGGRVPDGARGALPLAVSEGPLRAEVRAEAGGAPRLSVQIRSRRLVETAVRVPAGLDDPAYVLAIARLDAGTATPEVAVGVAARDELCCRTLFVATAHHDGPGYDTVPGFPRGALAPFHLADVDGDGRHEVLARERLELVAGACAPCRAEVPVVLGLAATMWTDRSAEPGFRGLHAAAWRRLVADSGADREVRDAAAEARFLLAAAALAARLGLIRPAWAAFRAQDLADRRTRRAVAELLREHRLVDASTPLEPRR